MASASQANAQPVDWSKVLPANIEEIEKAQAAAGGVKYNVTYLGRTVVVESPNPIDKASVQSRALELMKQQFSQAAPAGKVAPTAPVETPAQIQAKLVKAVEADPELKKMNSEMRKLEEQYALLEHMMDKKFAFNNGRLHEDPYPQLTIPNIRSQKTAIQAAYNKLHMDKGEYVKKTYPSNPVFAMCNPRTLNAGLTFYRSGDKAKIVKTLEQGWQWNEAGPATLFKETPGQTTSKWAGGNLMGEKGTAMSLNAPTYLRADAPYALGSRLVKPVDGVSIMTVNDLKNLIKFTPDQIEHGYRELQKQYTFLQTDALPPGDTEVVFQRLSDLKGSLVPFQVVSGEEEVVAAHKISEFSTKLSPQWSPPAAPPPKPTAAG